MSAVLKARVRHTHQRGSIGPRVPLSGPSSLARTVRRLGICGRHAILHGLVFTREDDAVVSSCLDRPSYTTSWDSTRRWLPRCRRPFPSERSDRRSGPVPGDPWSRPPARPLPPFFVLRLGLPQDQVRITDWTETGAARSRSAAVENEAVTTDPAVYS